MNSDYRFYLSGASITTTCTSTIASIDLGVGTNCAEQSNVVSCTLPTSNGIKTHTFSVGRYSCTTSPCDAPFYVIKVSVTCNGIHIPTFTTDGLYVADGSSTGSKIQNYRVGDNIKVQCQTSIQTATMKVGTNCPKESDLQVCQLVFFFLFQIFFWKNKKNANENLSLK